MRRKGFGGLRGFTCQSLVNRAALPTGCSAFLSNLLAGCQKTAQFQIIVSNVQEENQFFSAD